MAQAIQAEEESKTRKDSERVIAEHSPTEKVALHIDTFPRLTYRHIYPRTVIYLTQNAYQYSAKIILLSSSYI